MILRTFIIFLCEFGTLTAAAPVSVQYVAWHNEPSGRGTWGILSSCVTTLFLCVYTAVHTNIRPAYEDPKNRRWHLIYWVIYGILAPELVVFAAWCQWSEARLLTKEMQALRAELDTKNEPAPSRIAVGDEVELVSNDQPNLLRTAYNGDTKVLQNLLDSWTLTHSFFVVMGGYQFCPEAVETDFGGKKPKTMVHRECLLSLLRSGHASNIPLLSAEDLADRSKADNLAKIISCLQGTWLVLQLIGRLVDHLTITELEVNTFAHVLCALTIYALWMSKPFNIQRPCFVTSHGLEGWLSVHTSRLNKTDAPFACKAVLKDAPTGTERPVTHIHTEPVPTRQCRQCLRNLSLSKERSIYGLHLQSDVTITTEEVAFSLQESNSGQYIIDYVCRIRGNERGYEYEPSTQVKSWKMDAYSLPRLLRLWKLPEKDYEFNRLNTKTAPASNAYMIPSDAPGQDGKFLFMFGLASVYGGLHALLWNHHFPTVAEMWMWRISSIVVVGHGVSSIVLITIFTYGLGDILSLSLSFMNILSGFTISRWISVVVVGTYAITWAIFMFCRAFLFIDAFLTLRSQPPSVYQTPQWSQWLPHL